MAPARQRIARICEKCGTGFETTPAYLKKPGGRARFCSSLCANSGDTHPRWNGGRVLRPKGYIFARATSHPRAHNGYVFEHILIAEKALGKLLPLNAEIHHANEKTGDNRNENLVICQDRKYHKLLHFRMRLLSLGADPDTEYICGRCQSVKPLAEFHNHAGRPNGKCNQCKACSSKREAR